MTRHYVRNTALLENVPSAKELLPQAAVYEHRKEVTVKILMNSDGVLPTLIPSNVIRQNPFSINHLIIGTVYPPFEY